MATVTEMTVVFLHVSSIFKRLLRISVVLVAVLFALRPRRMGEFSKYR